MLSHPELKDRFRQYFPVIIDVETAGFNAQTDALLEIGAVTIRMDEHGIMHPDKEFHYHVEPFAGANIEQAALDFNGIKLDCALRGAVSESEAMKGLCKAISKSQKAAECQRSVIAITERWHSAAFWLLLMALHKPFIASLSLTAPRNAQSSLMPLKSNAACSMLAPANGST